MFKRVRTYRFLTQSLASFVFLASILPFIEHACLMAATSDMSVLRKCCCEKSLQHGDDSLGHGEYELMGEDGEHAHKTAKSGHAHHQTPDHHAEQEPAPAEPVEDSDESCDHKNDQPLNLADACCSESMQGFTDYTTARLKSTTESLTDLAAISFIASRLIEVLPPVIHPPPTGDPSPPLSISRQVLFATYLL